MLLGIDYGTTRTVVAAVYKGNYPIASFQNESGDLQDWYPSLIAVRGDERVHGFYAVAKQKETGWRLLRSLKRDLGHLSPDSEISVGDETITVLDLLTEFLSQLRKDLYERSNLRVRRKVPLEIMISVPANSNSNQRFITLEAFRRAGFQVRGMMNEPSAAGIEYAHNFVNPKGLPHRERVLVYDLGGGTFDASVVNIAKRRHEVTKSVGIGRLGGDDFDEILLALGLRHADMGILAEPARSLLLEECRERKEGLHPNTRSIAIDLGRAIDGAAQTIVSSQEFYEACRPLINRTLDALAAVTASANTAEWDWKTVAAIYLVGGSSNLPIVPRLLRERYGRKVRKSPYPHAATAIGLAIMADASAGYSLRERFTRHFGVWRERDEGRTVSLDVLFEKETPLPPSGEDKLRRARIYRPAHNIGHFRYLECSSIDQDGHPSGDINPWDEIYVAFDPDLKTEVALREVPVKRMELPEQLIEELYCCDSNGIIETTIINHTTGTRQSFRLRNRKRDKLPNT